MKIERKGLEKSLAIVAEILTARKRWGKGMRSPYTPDQLYDALIVLDEHGRFTGTSDEEVTKLRRQLAACQNREKGRKSALTPDEIVYGKTSPEAP